MRPIDADALVASLEDSYKELRKLYDEIKDGDGTKEVYQGELITFLEAILRAKNAPTLDYAPVVHGEWLLTAEGLSGVCKTCNRLDHIDPIAKYCRYCGAMMDGGKSDG